MLDTIGFNEGKDFLLGHLRGSTAISTVYFLLSNKPVLNTTTNGSHTLPTGTVTVVDTTGAPSSGTFITVGQTVTYTGKTGTTFTGCTGGTGTVPSGSMLYVTSGLQPTDVLSGVGEVAGWTGGATPYARISQLVPAPSNGIINFTMIQWASDTASNGPAVVASVIMATTADNTGKAVYAWNINAGGASVAFNGPNNVLRATPTFFLQNVGGS